MKKVRLRKWVAITLVAINSLLAMMYAVAFWESLLVEIYVKGFSIAIIILNTYLLIKYGDLEDRTDIEILND